MNKMKTDQCHQAVGRKFPPLEGRERQKFLKTGTSFLVVRDPFERLVSAYLDKLAKLNPDPKIQPKRRQIALYIKNKFRSKAQCYKQAKLRGVKYFLFSHVLMRIICHLREVPHPIFPLWIFRALLFIKIFRFSQNYRGKILKIFTWQCLYEPKEADYKKIFSGTLCSNTVND